MKKIILISILALSTIWFGCKKSNNRVLNPTVYCMFTEDGNTHIYRGCAESKEDMQKKSVELRDQGYTVVKSVEKNSCSECQ